jgi:V/A-type H+-transporting ATPase subunit D
MADLRRVPPGRAGRLWLQRRLRTGRLAADLLDRKLRILRTEQERYARLAEQTGAQWRDSCREADHWGLRGALVGGRRELRFAAPAQPADVSVEWANVMGIRYPVGATCVVPDPLAGARGPGTAALVEASAAYRTAVQAAATHAAAEAAHRAIAAEVIQTRRRLHAITDRWLPELEAALRERVARLEENERAESVRLRWAAASTATRGDGSAVGPTGAGPTAPPRSAPAG